MMCKFAVWIVILGIAWFAWQAWRRTQRAAALRETASDAVRPGALATPEAILKCVRCGVHVPASDAVRDGDAVFCSLAHRDAHRAASR